MNIGPIAAPAGATDCSPEITSATATTFALINTSAAKTGVGKGNFILGTLSGGVLTFVVENLPKTTPPTGCPGIWMFNTMMDHFGGSVTTVKGTWVGSMPGDSDNLDTINRLTAGNSRTVEDAAKDTWTGKRASNRGYTKISLASTPVGTPGNYTKVEVLFTK